MTVENRPPLQLEETDSQFLETGSSKHYFPFLDSTDSGTHGTYCPCFGQSHCPVTAPRGIKFPLDSTSMDTHLRIEPLIVSTG